MFLFLEPLLCLVLEHGIRTCLGHLSPDYSTVMVCLVIVVSSTACNVYHTYLYHLGKSSGTGECCASGFEHGEQLGADGQHSRPGGLQEFVFFQPTGTIDRLKVSTLWIEQSAVLSTPTPAGSPLVILIYKSIAFNVLHHYLYGGLDYENPWLILLLDGCFC